MKTSKNNLMAILVIGAAVLAASSASAGGFSFSGGGGGGGGGNKGGFKVTFNGNHNHNNHHHKHHGHHHHAHHGHYNHVRYYAPPVRLLYSQCYHPQFQCCYVFPGDNWYSISKRIYGVEFLCKHIASYNGLSMYSQLVPGQMLRLPVVNSNGSLGTSNAPMPAPFAPQGVPFAAQGGQIGPQASMIGPQGSPAGLAPQGSPNGLAPQGLPNGLNAGSIAPQGQSIAPLQNGVANPSVQPSATVTPAASIRTVTEEPTLPRVAIGSTLMLDGESLGTEKGIVRLQISGMTLPVDVIEWTASSVKVQLPKVDLSRPVKAELEVLRADGSPASNSAIELSPAATRLALGN